MADCASRFVSVLKAVERFGSGARGHWLRDKREAQPGVACTQGLARLVDCLECRISRHSRKLVPKIQLQLRDRIVCPLRLLLVLEVVKYDSGKIICVTPTRMGHRVAETSYWVVRQIFAALLEDRAACRGLSESGKASLAKVNKHRVQLARHLCPRERWNVARRRPHLTGEIHETLKGHKLIDAALQTNDILGTDGAKHIAWQRLNLRRNRRSEAIAGQRCEPKVIPQAWGISAHDAVKLGPRVWHGGNGLTTALSDRR